VAKVLQIDKGGEKDHGLGPERGPLIARQDIEGPFEAAKKNLVEGERDRSWQENHAIRVQVISTITVRLLTCRPGDESNLGRGTLSQGKLKKVSFARRGSGR